MSFIYLASPYAHSDPFVREHRYLQAMKVVALLMSRHVLVYSPIVHNHELAKVADAVKLWTHDDWLDYDLQMLELSWGLYVLMLPGWAESVGVQRETVHAQKRELPIHYITKEGANAS